MASYSKHIEVSCSLSHTPFFQCVSRETIPDGNTVQVRFNTFEGNDNYVFSLWFQYPLLAYLDTYRKQLLMQGIVDVLNNNTNPMAPDYVQKSNLCLGPYEIYGANTFNEG